MTYPVSQNQIEMLADMVKRENERILREFNEDPHSFYVSDHVIYEPATQERRNAENAQRD